MIKPVVVGILLGTGLFFMPFFIFRVVLFFLLFGLVVRLFVGKRRRFGGRFAERRFAFADRLRSMSEEEYAEFKRKAAQGCGRFEEKNFDKTQNQEA